MLHDSDESDSEYGHDVQDHSDGHHQQPIGIAGVLINNEYLDEPLYPSPQDDDIAFEGGEEEEERETAQQQAENDVSDEGEVENDGGDHYELSDDDDGDNTDNEDDDDHASQNLQKEQPQEDNENDLNDSAEADEEQERGPKLTEDVEDVEETDQRKKDEEQHEQIREEKEEEEEEDDDDEDERLVKEERQEGEEEEISQSQEEFLSEEDQKFESFELHHNQRQQQQQSITLYPDIAQRHEEIESPVTDLVATVESSSTFEETRDLFTLEKREEEIKMENTNDNAKIQLRIKCLDEHENREWSAASGGVATKGKNGAHGSDQRSSINGERGEDGEHGQPGSDGQQGLSGNHGRKGADSHSVFLKLKKTGEELALSGSIEKTVSLSAEGGAVVFIDGRGGRGENGGSGGKGGSGGNGGNGGAGGKGGNASVQGQNGGIGGNGGNGGSAGKGGHGGRGGNGGDGGKGAYILLESDDASLFALVEYDVSGGMGGRRGHGGAPGANGIPGVGGRAGKGGRGMYPGRDGQDGANGRDGIAAQVPQFGPEGDDGNRGATGGVCYVVRNCNDEVVERGNRRYNARILKFTVRGMDEDDGVLEPGERVSISRIVVVNDGDLTLPEGCSIRVLRSASFIPDDTQSHMLPRIAPGETYTTDFEITGRITFDANHTTALMQSSNGEFDEAGELSVRYRSTLVLVTECSLLGRSFCDSRLNCEITVEYPLRIERMLAPCVMAPQDNASFRIEFSNVSNKHYRSSEIPIKYRIHLYEHFVHRDQQIGKMIEGEIEEIAPHSACLITVPLTLQASEAEWYKNVSWRVELEFRDGLIEAREQSVRVCPRFAPIEDMSQSSNNDRYGDLLFISNAHINQAEYLLYRRIFDGLGLIMSYYDLQLYGKTNENTRTKPERQHSSWADHFHGKPVVLPLAEPHADLKSISGREIITHFTSMSYHEKTDKYDSGMLVIGDVTSRGGFSNMLLNELFQYSKYHLELSASDFSDTFYVGEPTRESMQAKMKDIVAKYAKDQPSQIYRTFLLEYAPSKISWSTYSYGRAQLKQLSLSRVHRMLFLGHPDETQNHSPRYLSNGLTSVQIQYLHHLTEIPVDSNMFELLLGVLCALSVEKKCEMIMRHAELPAMKEQWCFVIRSTSSIPTHKEIQQHQRQQEEQRQSSSGWMQSLSSALSRVTGDSSTTRLHIEESIRKIDLLDVIRTVLYDDLKREFFYSDQGLSRLERMTKYVRRHKQRFMTCQGVYSIWFLLSRLESHTFWRSLPYLSPLTEKRNQLLELKRRFEEEVFNFAAHGRNPQAITITHSKKSSNSETRIGDTSDDYHTLMNVDFDSLQREKERAQRDAEDRQRLKLQDMSKRLFHPFESIA